jgi:hypothetical protein
MPFIAIARDALGFRVPSYVKAYPSPKLRGRGVEDIDAAPHARDPSEGSFNGRS